MSVKETKTTAESEGDQVVIVKPTNKKDQQAKKTTDPVDPIVPTQPEDPKDPEIEHNEPEIPLVNPQQNTISVMNRGFYDLFEPFSKSKLIAGENTTIACPDPQQLKQVESNIEQLIILGRQLEIV